MSEIETLLAEIAELEKSAKKLVRCTDRLDRLRRDCNHRWSEPRRKSRHHEGYTIPGDPPGVGGSDHRFACHVDSKTDIWYERTCEVCQLVEKTTKTRPTGSEPVFRT